MRRLAQAIVGALALGLMMIALPWDLRECGPPDCFHSSDNSILWAFFGAALEVGFFAIILTVVLVGILGMRDAGRSSESAVYAALGRSRSSAVRLATKRGAIDGAIVTGGAFAIAGVMHIVIVLQSGYALFEQETSLWFTRLAEALVLTGALALAHLIDAVRPRRTPVERLHEDAEAPRPRRVPLALRVTVLGGVAAACVGVLTGVGLAHDNADGDAGTASTLLAQTAVAVLGFTGIALFFAVAVPLLRMSLGPAVRGAARAAAATKATRASAILATRSTTASGTSARTVLAIAGLALIAGAVCVADPAPSTSPLYVGTVTLQPTDAGDDVGAEYAAIDGVGKVVVGMQHGLSPAAVGVDVDEIAAVDATLAELMRSHPGAAVMQPMTSVSSLDSFAGQRIPVNGIVPISTCCTTFVDEGLPTGPATYAALVIYAAPGADLAAVSRRVEAYTPSSTNVQGWGASLAHYPNDDSQLWSSLFLWSLVVLVCLAPVLALAVGVASRRRRDDATLSALGATRRTLTGVAVLETTAIAVVSVAGGLLGGAVLQTSIAMASRARDSLYGLITDSYLRVGLHSVAWDKLAWIFVGAVAVFALVAWIATRIGARKLPVEHLRAAELGRIA